LHDLVQGFAGGALISPNAALLPSLADLVREAVQREGFRAFIRYFWEIAEPGAPFVESAYVHQLAEFLECTLRGEIKRWYVNLPPRMGKSTIISVLRTAYAWTKTPKKRFLSCSYDLGLVLRDAQRLVDVLESPLYRACWPKVKLRQPLAMGSLRTTVGGRRLGITLRSKGSTGWGSHDQVCDDPMKVQDSHSERERKHVKQVWTQTLANRIDGDPAEFTRGVTMQRLHEDDLSGLCKDMGYVGLVLPIGRKNSKGVWVDLLFPEKWPAVEVARLEAEMNSPAQVSAQLCQDPVPTQGGYVEQAWIKRYEKLPARPENVRWLQVWDLGFKGRKESHSRVAGILAFVFEGNAYIWDYFAEHVNYPETKDAFLELNSGGDWGRAGRIYVEDAANGPALIADLRAMATDARVSLGTRKLAAEVSGKIVPFPPGKLSKEERFALESDKIRQGRLFVKAGLDEVVQEVYRFPNATHDDLADVTAKLMATLSQAAIAGQREQLKRMIGRR
jgi:phage terminase large subunit-like protein